MNEKFQSILNSYEELTAHLGEPEVLSDQKEYARLAKAHSDMTPLALKIREYFGVLAAIDDAREMHNSETDADMREMAAEELRDQEARREQLEDELNVMMLPRTRTTTRTSSSRSARVPAATRPACSPAICTTCTHATSPTSVGRSRSSTPTRTR
jgi:protein subunit release factor A